MLILYITYIDFGASASGSTMRPQKMYQAFLDEGHEVKLLSGSQERIHRERRRAAVAEITAWLETNRPDLCYIESPVYPILWEFDRRLIRDIHARGIPCAYFTRDCYDRFPDMFPLRRDLPGRLKDAWLKLQRRRTEKTLQCVDIAYFPVKEMTALFSYRDMRALPPAGEDHLADSRPEGKRCVYVGGMVNQYGGELMLRAFRILNESGEYPLTVVCREKEWARIPEELKDASWLEVHHTSGEGLIPLLSSAAAGLMIGVNDYWEYTVSIKLFEYLGYGLPVAYIRSAPLDSFMERYGVGVGAERTPESLAAAVRLLLEDEERCRQFRANAAAALREGNLWVHRVRQVVRELTEEGE